MLLGFGLGVSRSTLYGIQNNNIVDLGLSTYHSFAFNAQVGGITMWNRYFGLQYYFGLDVIPYSISSASYTMYKGNVWLNGNSSAFKGTMIDTTLNADAVLNAY